MTDKNTLRGELLQITVVTLALLIVGMILWMGGGQKIQNTPVENATPMNTSEDLWTLVEGLGNSSFIADSVISGSADVRDIRSDNAYDTANGTTRVLHLISAQSCYQALSTELQKADYLSSLLMNDNLSMDVVVYGKYRALRHEILLYDKMHKPAYDLYYWTADWDEGLPPTSEIALIQDGKVTTRMGEADR